MSYSFDVRASTKVEAKAFVAAKLDQVVADQPVHAADKPQALAAASSFIDLLSDDDTKDVRVCMSGSVGWSGVYGSAEGHATTSANVSVSAWLVSKNAE